MQPTETRFLTRASAGPEQWQSAVSSYASDPMRRPVPLSDTDPDDCLVAHPADGRLRTILAPEDPVRMLLRHRAAVEQLRMAMGSRKLFEAHLMPAMAGWAAMVQGLPRDERGLWSGPDGLFEAGLMFARGAINAVDARVIGPELAPGIRDDWTLRLRIASALAGLMSDSRKLAALKLEAGSEDPATGTFTVTSRFNPSEETALSFCVHEIGRVMRLERHTARESAGRLPTLNADVLRLVVPRETLMWLGVIERPDGETVLTALKAAVTYAAGQTEAERLIAEAAARGREWAINRRAAEAARREGKSPLLRGFASVYRAEFSQRLYDGHWRLNRGDSPVVWADDGLALRWPEGFTAIAATADDKWLFRDVPDEPDVAAEILVADGFAMADEAGNPLWLTDSDCMAGEGAWLRLTDCDMLVANARRAADAAGESLPMRFPALFEKRPSSSARSGGTVARQCWALSVPSELEASDKAAALARALEAVNTRDDAVMLVHPEGVFVPESLLPVGWIEDPAEAGILLRVKAMPFAEGVRHMRASPIRRVRMTGHNREHYAKITASLQPVLSMLTGGTLAKSFSPDPFDPDDERPIVTVERVVEGGDILYLGLDALPDSTVAGALGSIILADLTAYAGKRYNRGESGTDVKSVSLFVDETANVINGPMIELLNKGLEAGIRVTAAMQTVSDLAARLGSDSRARMALGNFNNLIALRSKDRLTQEFICETFGKTTVWSTSASLSSSADGSPVPDFRASVTRSIQGRRDEVVPPDVLGRLPNTEFFASVSGGRLYKGRIPILLSDD